MATVGPSQGHDRDGKCKREEEDDPAHKGVAYCLTGGDHRAVRWGASGPPCAALGESEVLDFSYGQLGDG